MAILCPGPTALDYNNDCDISIALNSALKLDKHIDYFMGFDCKIPYADYFKSKPEITRILGANIYQMCPFSYLPGSIKPRLFRTLNMTPDIDLPPTIEPHWYWYYKYNERPQYRERFQYFSACSNIIIPALELACHWDVKSIYIYGASMNTSKYFYDTEKEHKYTDKGISGVNNLIASISRNIPVYVKREKDTKITQGISI
jgi:hypothetical protein